VIREEWETIQNADINMHKMNKALLRGFSIDLDGVYGVEDILNIWRAQRTPPLLENVIGACNCDDCLRRLGREKKHSEGS
jgi:hypothetical protein